jgi:1-acyl-sn-glycerol-3-phosphate acyltransferase
MTDPTETPKRSNKRPLGTGRTLSLYLRRAFYRVMRIVARVVFVLCFRIRVEGRHHVPLEGGGTRSSWDSPATAT